MKVISFASFLLLSCQLSNIAADSTSLPKHKEAIKCIQRKHQDSTICKKWFQSIHQVTRKYNEAKKKSLKYKTTSSQRIVNGVNVPEDEYPWFAKALFGSSPYEYWGGCGGMLVAPDWVLTAAHCTVDNAYTAWQIGALSNPIRGSNGGQYNEILTVKYKLEHPDYNKNNYDNDFALVKLTEASTITPVDMDLSGVVNSFGQYKKLWPIGFGTLESDGGTPDWLQHVEVSFVPKQTCDNNYGSMITDNMICAADPGEDSCQGDSGGPLYDKQSKKLVGVVSWGYGCASDGYPGVYAKVSAQAQWIKETICSDTTADLDYCEGLTPRPTVTASKAPSAAPTISTAPTKFCGDVPNWTDAYGDGCNWYTELSCSFYGSGYAGESGLTANDACCICGGGGNGDESIPTASPISYSPTVQCFDTANWVDSWGDDCSWYTPGDVCETYGSGLAGPSGLNAQEACCSCGGGSNSESEDGPQYTCSDFAGFQDGWGDTCSWYVGNEGFCHNYANSQGVTAADACCTCGGGDTVEVDEPVEGEQCENFGDFVDFAGDNCDWYDSEYVCDMFGSYVNDDGVTPKDACCQCGGGLISIPGEAIDDIVCVDSPTRLLVNKVNKKSCNWVGNKLERCDKNNIKSHCPLTCGVCDEFKCEDSARKFFLPNGNVKKCGWVGRKDTEERCALEGVAETCRKTCGMCD